MRLVLVWADNLTIFRSKMSGMPRKSTRKPLERARATEGRLGGHIEQALRNLGELDDKAIKGLMAEYEAVCMEPSEPASSAALRQFDEQNRRVPLD